MTETPEALDYGLDAALEAAETQGQAKAAEIAANKPPRKARKTHTTAIAELVAAGKPAPLLTFGSAANPHYDRHAQALHHYYALAWNNLAPTGVTEAYIEAYDALGTYPLAGVNTYAKALISYRALLVNSLKEQPKDTKAIKVTPLPELKAKAKAEAPADKPKAAPKAKGVDVNPESKTFGKVVEFDPSKTSTANKAAHKAKNAPLPEAATTKAKLKAQAAALAAGDPDETTIHELSEMSLAGEVQGSGIEIETATGKLVKPDGSYVFEVDDAPDPMNGDEGMVDELDQGPAPDVVSQVPEKVKTFATKVAAIAQARQDMGDDVVEGIDFVLVKVGKAWAVKQMAVG